MFVSSTREEARAPLPVVFPLQGRGQKATSAPSRTPTTGKRMERQSISDIIMPLFGSVQISHGTK